jgi:4-hydroxybenzoate polyprenyltransferase
MSRQVAAAPAITRPPRRRFAQLRDRLQLMRPYSLLWFVAAPIATMALWLDGEPPIATLAALIVCLALTDAGLTTLNDIADGATDRASVEPQRHGRPVAAERVSVRDAYVQVVLLELGALAAAIAISPPLAVLVALAIVYGVAYSARPISLGGRPFLSQAFWILLWPVILLAVYIVLSGELARGVPYVVATVFFMGIGETLAKDVRDVDNDALAGKRTTPVAVGVPAASCVAVVAFAVGSVGYVLAAVLVAESAVLVLALLLVLGLWCGRAAELAATLRREYRKDAARALHMGALRVFLTVNLLTIVALAS